MWCVPALKTKKIFLPCSSWITSLLITGTSLSIFCNPTPYIWTPCRCLGITTHAHFFSLSNPLSLLHPSPSCHLANSYLSVKAQPGFGFSFSEPLSWAQGVSSARFTHTSCARVAWGLPRHSGAPVVCPSPPLDGKCLQSGNRVLSSSQHWTQFLGRRNSNNSNHHC